MTTQVLTASGPGPAIPLHYTPQNNALPVTVVCVPNNAGGQPSIAYIIEATNDDPTNSSAFWFQMPISADFLPGGGNILEGFTSLSIPARYQALRGNVLSTMPAGGSLTLSVSA